MRTEQPLQKTPQALENNQISTRKQLASIWLPCLRSERERVLYVQNSTQNCAFDFENHTFALDFATFVPVPFEMRDSELLENSPKPPVPITQLGGRIYTRATQSPKEILDTITL